MKFVGDNVDKKREVRNIRSDHHGELKHMYSLLAVKARVKPPPLVSHFVPPHVSNHQVSHFPFSSVTVAVAANIGTPEGTNARNSWR